MRAILLLVLVSCAPPTDMRPMPYPLHEDTSASAQCLAWLYGRGDETREAWVRYCSAQGRWRKVIEGGERNEDTDRQR